MAVFSRNQGPSIKRSSPARSPSPPKTGLLGTEPARPGRRRKSARDRLEETLRGVARSMSGREASQAEKQLGVHLPGTSARERLRQSFLEARTDGPAKELGEGRPLPEKTRHEMEQGFHVDLSRVRVHTDERAAESARRQGAIAYTVGQDLVFGAGRFAPETKTGRDLLAHELAHAIQQGPNGNRHDHDALAKSSPGDRHEREADRAVSALRWGLPMELERGAAPAVMRATSQAQAGTSDKEDPHVEELKSKISALVNSKFKGDFHAAFDAYDLNHDGGIDHDELKHLLADAGIGNGLTRGAWVDGIMKKLDTNHDGKISWGEFQAAIH